MVPREVRFEVRPTGDYGDNVVSRIAIEGDDVIVEGHAMYIRNEITGTPGISIVEELQQDRRFGKFVFTVRTDTGEPSTSKSDLGTNERFGKPILGFRCRADGEFAHTPEETCIALIEGLSMRNALSSDKALKAYKELKLKPERGPDHSGGLRLIK